MSSVRGTLGSIPIDEREEGGGGEKREGRGEKNGEERRGEKAC
jgi:hypothetical protein